MESTPHSPLLRVSLMGLSGVGKTRAVAKLKERTGGDLNVYAVDAHIWLDDSPLRRDFEAWAARTGEDISTVTANNLGATARYLGMMGFLDNHQSVQSEAEFRRKMQLHYRAEQAAVAAVPKILQNQGGNWVVDLSGSFCEVVDPWSPADPLIHAIAGSTRSLYVEASNEHVTALAHKQSIDPKPLYYRPGFLDEHLPQLLRAYGASTVNDLSQRQVSDYLYPRLVRERMVRYRQIAAVMGDRAMTLDMTTSRGLSVEQLYSLFTPSSVR